MDEFKPEDELKADSSDRHSARSRRASSAPKVPVSRQHMMLGIGILVLLILVIGIGSALKGPGDTKPTAQQPTTGSSVSGEKSIDLSASSSMSNASDTPAVGQEPLTSPSLPVDNNVQNGNSSQSVGLPPVSPTPTEAVPVQTPADQQRVDLPGDLNDALSSQQGAVDTASTGAQNSHGLPTAPATVSGKSENLQPVKNTAPRQQTPVPARKETTHKTVSKPVARESSKPAARTETPSGRATASHSSATPSGNYTLQLSSASRSDTLNAWAKKQNLSGYHVYKTTRNGQPWYILVSGSYATPADAKRAVSGLPAEVRAQNPWVKPLSQVKKEAQ